MKTFNTKTLAIITAISALPLITGAVSPHDNPALFLTSYTITAALVGITAIKWARSTAD